MLEKRKLSFIIEGEGLFFTLKDFYESGLFNNLINSLDSLTLTKEQKKDFLLGKYKMTGRSDNESLCLVPCENSFGCDISEIMITGFRTYLNSQKFKIYKLDAVEIIEKKGIKDFADIIGTEILLDFLQKFLYKEKREYLSSEGYNIIPFGTPIDNSKIKLNGTVLNNGDYIECGYQGHSDLMWKLYEIGLVDNRDWTESENSIHISYGNISGFIPYEVRSLNIADIGDFNKIRFLAQNCKELNFYGSYNKKTISYKLLCCYQLYFNKGNKYNNLLFIKDYLHNFKLDIEIPKISLQPIPEVKNCIRTSPKNSIPGVLNSCFNIYPEAVEDIKKEWLSLDESLTKNNELHLFYQEYLEGINGVIQYNPLTSKDKSCDIRLGNQHDVVQGKPLDFSINFNMKESREKLNILMFKLQEEFPNYFIQLEFVETKTKLYIVQFRIQEVNLVEDDKNLPDHYELEALTFTQGTSELVVNSEVYFFKKEVKDPSKELKNIKLLIINNDQQFSHLVAYAKQNKIATIVVKNMEYTYGLFQSFKSFKIVYCGMNSYIVSIN